MRGRLNVVERDGGQEGIDIEVWKGKLHYEESRTILYVAKQNELRTSVPNFYPKLGHTVCVLTVFQITSPSTTS